MKEFSISMVMPQSDGGFLQGMVPGIWDKPRSLGWKIPVWTVPEGTVPNVGDKSMRRGREERGDCPFGDHPLWDCPQH